MYPSNLLRAAARSPTMGTIEMNPYKAQKAWPPNFAHLDAKHQFRLERKFRRRSKLKFVRPRWVKGVKLAQWGLCLGKWSKTEILPVVWR